MSNTVTTRNFEGNGIAYDFRYKDPVEKKDIAVYWSTSKSETRDMFTAWFKELNFTDQASIMDELSEIYWTEVHR